MRVTNQMMSTTYLKDLNTNLNNLNTLNKQLTTGKEISKPSDNPFKTARIMQMYSDIAANKQYNENIKDTISWLDTTDTALNQLGSTSQRIRELMVSSGNAIYGSDEKKAIKIHQKDFPKKHLSVSGENNGCFKLEKRKVHQSKIKTALKQRYNGI